MVENESVSVTDYSHMGEQSVVQVDGVAADAFVGLSVTKPAEKIFRVIERRAQLCCPAGGNKKIALDLTHPDWTVADYNYHLIFKWTVK